MFICLCSGAFLRRLFFYGIPHFLVLSPTRVHLSWEHGGSEISGWMMFCDGFIGESSLTCVNEQHVMAI